MTPKQQIDVIIPTYNGKYLLEKNLSSIVKNTSSLGKLIIIDNGSEDGTAEWLKKEYPETVIVRNNTNLGYTIPINQGVRASKSEYFILINNDVRPKKGYLDSSLELLKSKEIFAVTFNEESSSWPDMKWANGKMQFSMGEDKSKTLYSAWASGGSAIFKRSIWDKLGGLDEIYAPWYWEDIDIGYRAWKTGYKIIWNPKSVVIHEHESTSKKLDPKYVNLIKQRNELIFNWLNVNDSNLVFKHILFLITHTLSHPGYAKIILAAIYRLITHRSLKRNFTISDSMALNSFSKKYEN